MAIAAEDSSRHITGRSQPPTLLDSLHERHVQTSQGPPLTRVLYAARLAESCVSKDDVEEYHRWLIAAATSAATPSPSEVQITGMLIVYSDAVLHMLEGPWDVIILLLHIIAPDRQPLLSSVTAEQVRYRFLGSRRTRSSGDEDAPKLGAAGLQRTTSTNGERTRDQHPSIEAIRTYDDRKLLRDATVLTTTDDIPSRAFSFWDTVFASPSQQLTSAIDTSKPVKGNACVDMVSEMNIDLLKAGMSLSAMSDAERALGLRSLRLASMLNVHAAIESGDAPSAEEYLKVFDSAVEGGSLEGEDYVWPIPAPLAF